MSLTAPQLYDDMTAQAQQQWRITKSPTMPYNDAIGMEELLRSRPELYTRYQAQAMKHDTAPAPLVPQAAAASSRDQARADLEALAQSSVSMRLAHDEAEGLTMAIQARPDLYKAFTSLPAGPATPDPDPLRELHRLARDYVSKRLVDTEAASLERAIRDHPELYDTHRRQVQAVSVQKVVR
jgi:hypothetical protein